MNKIDRSSDNWKEGPDSLELAEGAEFVYFDEAEQIISRAVMHQLSQNMDNITFAVILEKLHNPAVTLTELANRFNMTRQSINKKIGKVCERYPFIEPLLRNQPQYRMVRMNHGNIKGPDPITKKVCTKNTCIHQGKPQEITNFHKNSRQIDGLHTWCKDCVKAYHSDTQRLARRRAKRKGRK